MPDLTANSAMSANSNVLGYQEWGHQQGYMDEELGYGPFGGLFNFWGNGVGDQARAGYEAYKTQNERDYELGKINDARRWEEYMDSTKYQRMAKDLEAAGFNPGVVLASGIGASGQPSTSINGGSSSVHSAYPGDSDKSKDAKKMATNLAATAIRAIAMIAAFA